ncbi:MAG: pentapeptide repeat-containing protein [Nitrospinae bacterium]|nr:pentapeptide repeat-containing protein [Nitrospinota bacterium]
MRGKGNGETASGKPDWDNIAKMALAFIAYLAALYFFWLAMNELTYNVPDTQVQPGSTLTLEQKYAAESRHHDAGWRTLFGVFSFAAALVTLSFAYWRTSIADKSAQTDRQRLDTETFSRAIEQLGARDGGKPILEMRLGGIYTLERLMKETGDHDFYWQIVETLTAYVRKNSPSKIANIGALSAPQKDIQAIVTVIGRRPKDKDRDRVPDLSMTNLQQINMNRLDAGKLNLTGAHLQAALLLGTHLEGADLEFALLTGANLEKAHLEGAIFKNALIDNAKLREAHLEKADLRWAHLQGALFGGDDPTIDAVGLTVEQLEQAYGDDTTLLPTYLRDKKINWRN